MTTVLVFIAIIFMMWYTEKVKSDTINKIESKFESLSGFLVSRDVVYVFITV